MASPWHHRAFALSLAALFFLTAFGFSFIVIWQAVSSSNKNSNASNSSKTSTNQTCQDSQAEATLPAPAAYKPTEPVTSLQVTDLTTGTGAAAKAGDCLVVKYYGTLASDGTVFDQNFDQPTALAFPLGEGKVIAGWDQGLVGMKVGGTRRLVIPAALAYGSQSPSETIPPNSDLVFVVNLLRIQ